MANNLTLNNATFGTGKFGQALSAGNALAPPGLLAKYPYTVEALFRTTIAQGMVFAQTSMFYVIMQGDGTLLFDVGGSDEFRHASSTPCNDGAFHHVEISATVQTTYVFVDGNLIASGPSPGLGFDPNGALGIATFGQNGGYQFPGPVDEVAVWGICRHTASFTPAASAYTGSESGLLALWHLDGDGSDSVMAGTPVTILANDPAIVFSPYTWVGGRTINAGAYFRTTFSGKSISLTFDLSAVAGPAPEIYVSIDRQPAQKFSVAASIVPTMPTATAAWQRHTLDVTVKATSQNSDAWNSQQQSVTLTSITLQNAASAVAPGVSPQRLLIYGDSITEGIRTLTAGATPDTADSDSTSSWALELRDLLGTEVGVVGFGATGITTGGNRNVPAVGQSFNKMWANQARSFLPAPSMIVINEGTNDVNAAPSVMQAGYVAFLQALLAAVPNCPVACLRPFSGAQAAAIQAAISQVGSGRVHYVDTTGLWDSTLSNDAGIHPSGVANLMAIGPGVANLLRPLLSPSVGVPTQFRSGFH